MLVVIPGYTSSQLLQKDEIEKKRVCTFFRPFQRKFVTTEKSMFSELV